MEINNNYSHQQANFKQLKEETNIPEEHIEEQAPQAEKKALNFTGLRQMFMPLRAGIEASMKPKNTKQHMEFLDHVAKVIGVDEKVVKNASNGKTNGQFEFLNCMTEHYNSRNFNLETTQRDNPEAVLDLFNRIDKPKDGHKAFVANTYDLSMQEVKECFDKFSDNSDMLLRLQDIYHSFRFAGVGAGKGRSKLTMDLVRSQNAQEYVANYNKYKGFIDSKMFAKEQDIITQLDNHVAQKGFISGETLKMNKINEALDHYPKEAGFKASELISKYSEEGNGVLEALNMKLAPTAETLEKSGTKAYVDIYSTTNKENVNFRRNFLEVNYVNRLHAKEDKQYPADEIEKIKTIFDMADKDKTVFDAIDKMMQEGVSLHAEEYLTLLDNFGAEALLKDSKGVSQAINADHYHPLRGATTYFEEKPKNIGDSIGKFFRGIFGIKKPAKKQPASGDIVNIQRQELPKPEIKPEIKPETKQEIKPEVKPEVKPEIKKEPEIDKEADERFMPHIIQEEKPVNEAIQPAVVEKAPVSPTVQEAETEVKVAPKSVKPQKVKLTKEEYRQKIWADFFKKYPPKQPTVKQLKIMDDIKPMLEKSLGSKTMSEQERLYTINATKMRASMLPEMFASVKETRAAARAANGGKLPKGFAQNSDVYSLYVRLNGKNKKLINYMLKITDENGNRRYNVNDILDKLGDANRQIIKGQSASTKGNRFTAKDERAIYDAMLEDLTAQHGKLKKAPRTKTTKK